VKIPSQMNPGKNIVCCWETCDNDGDDTYQVKSRASNGGKLVWVFCCADHRKFFKNSHSKMGFLPVGERSTRFL
jgi:hypothetical protein